MAYLVAEIGPTKGFHPVSSTTVYLPNPQKDYDQCSLYIYHKLPPLLFVDTHELSQRNESYTFNHWGSRDLEKPVHALPDEISELLLDILDIRLPDVDVSENTGEGDEGRTIHIEVPMHLRYGSPKSSSSSGPSEEMFERIQVEWPQAFLSCPLPSPLKAHSSISLSQNILSALPSQPNHIQIPIPPHSNFTSETSTDLFLPLGNTRDLAFVEPLTAFTILACCLWIFRMALKTFARLAHTQTQRPKTS